MLCNVEDWDDLTIFKVYRIYKETCAKVCCFYIIYLSVFFSGLPNVSVGLLSCIICKLYSLMFHQTICLQMKVFIKLFCIAVPLEVSYLLKRGFYIQWSHSVFFCFKPYKHIQNGLFYRYTKSILSYSFWYLNVLFIPILRFRVFYSIKFDAVWISV